MAGIRPTFITGATAKIRLNGKTIAFCQDFNCSVQIITQTPKVLGKYEGDSVEPLGYLVSGSFSILRYAKGIRSLNPNVPAGLAENDAGNGVGNWGTVWGGKSGDRNARNGIGNDGRAHEALDPSKFATGTTFDIQVYQKVGNIVPEELGPVVGGTMGGTLEGNLRDVTELLNGGNFAGPGANMQHFLGVLNVRNARISQADFSLSKKAVATERFNFVALYVDGDGFVANASGPL